MSPNALQDSVLAATYFGLYISVNRYEESEHMEQMKIDKKVDWKKTNSKSITTDRSLCHSHLGIKLGSQKRRSLKRLFQVTLIENLHFSEEKGNSFARNHF